ncbi:MAG: chemotaxis protein CheB [Candidatus Cloacimonetes bacterium]|nr:chemotaxis protein CheB [Candidatus Cloacimonadota bacterium]
MKTKNNFNISDFKAIVIGVSAGGFEALTKLFSTLPKDFPLPIIVVQHIHKYQSGYLFEHLNKHCALKVKEADEKETIKPGNIYFAPPNYHLLIEEDKTFSLSVDEKVNYSRPSIDVLFKCAAEVYKNQLIGIILTGANDDGAEGMRIIKENGGLTIAQDPRDAEFPVMPQSAIDKVEIGIILTLENLTFHFSGWHRK